MPTVKYGGSIMLWECFLSSEPGILLKIERKIWMKQNMEYSGHYKGTCFRKKKQKLGKLNFLVGQWSQTQSQSNVSFSPFAMSATHVTVRGAVAHASRFTVLCCIWGLQFPGWPTGTRGHPEQPQVDWVSADHTSLPWTNYTIIIV